MLSVSGFILGRNFALVSICNILNYFKFLVAVESFKSIRLKVQMGLRKTAKARSGKIFAYLTELHLIFEYQSGAVCKVIMYFGYIILIKIN